MRNGPVPSGTVRDVPVPSATSIAGSQAGRTFLRRGEAAPAPGAPAARGDRGSLGGGNGISDSLQSGRSRAGRRSDHYGRAGWQIKQDVGVARDPATSRQPPAYLRTAVTVICDGYSFE